MIYIKYISAYVYFLAVQLVAMIAVTSVSFNKHQPMNDQAVTALYIAQCLAPLCPSPFTDSKKS